MFILGRKWPTKIVNVNKRNFLVKSVWENMISLKIIPWVPEKQKKSVKKIFLKKVFTILILKKLSDWDPVHL